MDVPAPRWTARLVADTEGGRQRLRDLRLQDAEALSMQYGGALPGSPGFSLRLSVRRLVDEEIAFQHAVRCQGAGDSRARLDFTEEGEVTLSPGQELLLLTPGLPAQRAELGRLLGLGKPVERLALRFATR